MARVDAERPVFVYGTLRPGEANWRQLADRVTAVVAARLPDHRLYALEYPCIVREEGSAGVHGDLAWLEPNRYATHLAHLDRFEGFRPHDESGSLYVRARARVETDAGTIDCWTYIAGRSLRDRLRPEHHVPGGDWSIRSHPR